jgi:hypothetical protein
MYNAVEHSLEVAASFLFSIEDLKFGRELA